VVLKLCPSKVIPSMHLTQTTKTMREDKRQNYSFSKSKLLILSSPICVSKKLQFRNVEISIVLRNTDILEHRLATLIPFFRRFFNPAKSQRKVQDKGSAPEDELVDFYILILISFPKRDYGVQRCPAALKPPVGQKPGGAAVDLLALGVGTAGPTLKQERCQT
jgi:hypothetical protein